MIPRFQIFGTCSCEEDGEFEGKVLQVRWLGLIFEFAVLRRDRTVDA